MTFSNLADDRLATLHAQRTTKGWLGRDHINIVWSGSHIIAVGGFSMVRSIVREGLSSGVIYLVQRSLYTGRRIL